MPLLGLRMLQDFACVCVCVCVCVYVREHVDLGLKTELEALLEQLSYFMELLNGLLLFPEEVDPFIHSDEAAAACWLCHPLRPVLLRFRDLRELRLCLSHRARCASQRFSTSAP